jgi:hypothetical protein
MKITIASTDKPTRTVSFEIGHDELDIDDMAEAFRGLLISYGFAEKSVDSILITEMSTVPHNYED